MTKAITKPSLLDAAEVLDEVQPKRLPAYLAYRDSGVRWLGEIPEHWRVRKLKFIADVRTSNVDKKTVEDQEPVQLCNYVDVYYNDYITADIEFMAASATGDQIKRFKIKSGDVIITKDSEAWDDIAVPAVVDQEFEDVLCGYHLALIRPDHREAVGDYLFRAFEANAVRDQFRVRANGITRYGLTRDGMTSALFPVPPLDEQKAIASFLRRETAKIDGLVEKKRRLIELLREKRTALISHAVTKGLNPDAPMKPSGIDWLGDVPEHWEVIPLRHLCESIQTGPFGSQLHQQDYLPGGVPVINPVHLVAGRVMPDVNSAVDDLTVLRLSRHCVEAGDILFARRGEIGRCGIVEDNQVDWLCGTGCMRVRLSKGDPRYYNLVFNSRGFAATLTVNAVGTTMLNINNAILSRMPLPWPPCDEQSLIVRKLHEADSQISSLVNRVLSAIKRLEEYRSALITAAVTGKIDVRGEVAG